ncbi:hypothetical protein ACFVWG_12805 [Kribbella sp. NPDC058245]|uniref:hypothetical protein n=1 Tax=Kribbella sp. NPDC058245 TaxID=3346399 RepID=UPI0036E7355F
MRYLLRAFGNYPRDQVWLLGTDADTRVRPDWIERQLDHAQRVDTGEDRDLWFRLEAAGYAMLQPRDLDVLTSSRLRGRAHGGLADLLTAMCTPGVPVAVGIDQEEPHAPET